MIHEASILELCKCFQVWPHDSKSIMTAGTTCTTGRYIFCGHLKHWVRDTFRTFQDYRWTLPVRWDWLLISGGRSDSVGALSGSPPCRYMLCEEAAPLRSITQTSVWETDMTHVRQNEFENHTLRRGCYVCADLIHELYRKSVTVVQRWMVRPKRDLDVHALFRSDAALYWYYTEHTQPAVILGFYGIQEQKLLKQCQDPK